MASSSSSLLPLYGATTTTLLTTTILLSSNQASYTILFPPPATEGVRYTTLPALQNPSSTFTPSPLPVLVLTNIIGIAVNPSGSPIGTRTLSQTPPPQATNTRISTSTPAASNCPSWKWNCWPITKQIGIALGIGLGILLLLLYLWWFFFWRVRIRKIRIRRGRPGDEEGGGGRPPLKIAVRTSMSHMRGRSMGAKEEGSLSPSPPPRGDGGVRVVVGSGNGIRNSKEPPAYKVVRQPSPRAYIRPVPMPEGPMKGDMDGAGEIQIRDFAVPVAAAGFGAEIGKMTRNRRGSQNEGGVRVSRGESTRESQGSRRDRRDSETGMNMAERTDRNRDRDREGRDGPGRRRSRSHCGREREYNELRGERRRRRHSYTVKDEEDLDVRRDRSPLQRSYKRDEGRHRRRSVSRTRQQRSKDEQKQKQKQKKRGDSEGAVGNGLKKLLPFLPLVLGLMTTIGEPKGGWDQYIPEEKRKKSKVKKIAEDVFDKHHHKIPEDFPRHLHQHSSRTKSVDRAYRSSRSRRSPPFHEERRRRSRSISRTGNNYTRYGTSSYPVRNTRDAFDNNAPDAGSSRTSLTPSPPPRLRRSARERRDGGYDGADDDDDLVVHSAGTTDRIAGDVVLPYEISEPESPDLRPSRTLHFYDEVKKSNKHGPKTFMPPTPPSTVR